MERDNKYIYNILPRIMCSCVKYTSVFLAQNFGKNIFHFNFLIQLFTYLYLEKTQLLYVRVYFAYRYHYCFLELYFLCISINKRIKTLM